MSEKFKYEFTCVNGHETRMQLTKIEAAFEDKDEYQCPNCGSVDKETASGGIPNLDTELMTIWLNDESLSFSNFDEENYLSMHPAALFIQHLDTAQGIRYQQLISAMKLKISDNDFFTPTGRRDLQVFLSKRLEHSEMGNDPVILKFIKSGFH